VDVIDESSPSERDYDSIRVEIGSELVSKQSEFGTGPEPVPEFGEIGVEPLFLFEGIWMTLLIGSLFLREKKRLRSLS